MTSSHLLSGQLETFAETLLLKFRKATLLAE